MCASKVNLASSINLKKASEGVNIIHNSFYLQCWATPTGPREIVTQLIPHALLMFCFDLVFRPCWIKNCKKFNGLDAI